MKHNVRVRESLSRNKMYLYQLAELLKVSEPTITRMMRKELPEEEQTRIIAIIEGGVKE